MSKITIMNLMNCNYFDTGLSIHALNRIQQELRLGILLLDCLSYQSCDVCH